MKNLTIEEALRHIQESAAMLAFLVESVSVIGHVPEMPVFNGISNVCSEIEELAEQAKDSLSVEALGRALKRKRC